jgi:hypothetical protein
MYSSYSEIFVNQTTTGAIGEIITNYIFPPAGFSYSPMWRVSADASRLLVAYGSNLNPTNFPNVAKNQWSLNGDTRHLYLISLTSNGGSTTLIEQPVCPYRFTELCGDLSPLPNQLNYTYRYADIETFGFSADGNRVFCSVDRDDLPPLEVASNSGNVLGYIRDMSAGTFQKILVSPGVVFTDSIYPGLVLSNDGNRAIYVGFNTPFENENCYRRLHYFDYANQRSYPVIALNGTCPSLNDFEHTLAGSDGRYVYLATANRIYGYHPSGTSQIYRWDFLPMKPFLPPLTHPELLFPWTQIVPKPVPISDI